MSGRIQLRVSTSTFPLRLLLQLACILLLCAGMPAARACDGGGATCSASNTPTTRAASGPLNIGAGNPINVASGNKYQREVDMPPLPGVLGLEIVRHYNSVASGPNRRPNALGRGWRLSYEAQLTATPYSVEITQADGSTQVFARDLVQPGIARPRDPSQGSVAIKRGARGDEYV